MPHHCAQAAGLEKLLGERLTVYEVKELTKHLDECTTCQQRLEELMEANPEWSEAVRQVGSQPAEKESALLRVMDGMREITNLTRMSAVDDKMLLGLLDPPDKPGQLGRLGRYAITEVVGRGGMGVVLKAIDPALDRVVAMKVLAPHLASCAAARRRFAREAQAAAAVSHDHVVAIHAVEEANGLPFLVMQYVPGISLQERLDRTGPLQLREILRIGMQTAAGLAAAHAQGLVHRDIKPANILLENGVERVRITDFGLARAVDDASLTQSGVLAGTPQYMSPEQARGDTVDHRADLFSLGSVLYALCTGRPPFRASTTMGVLKRVSDRTPRSILEINPDIPVWLVAIIEKLHAKAPAQRFQTAAELAGLLGQYLAHVEQPEQVPLPANPLPRLRSPAGGKSTASLWQGAASLVLLLGLGFAITHWPGATAVWNRIGAIVSPSARESGPAMANVPSRAGAILSATLAHETGAVFGVAFSPAGELLATGSDDATVKIWDLTSRQQRRTLEGHTRRVWSVAFAGNGRILASGAGTWGVDDQAGEIMVWDATTGERLFSLDGHRGIVFSVAFSPDSRILASAAGDRTVRLWDLARQREQRRLQGHQGPVRSVAFSVDGKTLASGSFDGTTRLWDVATGQLKATLPSHVGAVNCVAFSPDGRTLAIGEFGHPLEITDTGAPLPGQVTLWDLATGKERTVLRGHRGRLLSLAFSPDSTILATSGGYWTDFGEVKLWDVTTGRHWLDLHGHKDWVECVAFSPDGKTLVSGGGTQVPPGDVKLWDVDRGNGEREPLAP